MPINILVMGAGAVGCYYGGMLALAGHQVTLVARQKHVRVLKQEGLLFESAHFTGRISVQASLSSEDAASANLVLFSVKSGDTESAGRALAAHLIHGTPVLSLQNGIDNAERLSTILQAPVIPAVVYVAVEMAGPGHLRHHGRGELVIGPSPDSERIATALSEAEIPTTVSPEVASALWEKLIINCAFNALSAIPHLCYGELIQQTGVFDAMKDVILEGLAVARAAGVEIRRDLQQAALNIAESMATQYSSTAQDLLAGKPSEIDHLNGYVVRKGQELGIPTPANRMLQVIVHLMEARHPPNP